MEYKYNKFALKAIRTHFGYRRGYIPTGINVPVNTYKSWEDGCIMSVHNLLKVCNYMRISIWSFIDIEGTPDADHVRITEKSDLAGFKPTVFRPDVMSVYLNKELGLPVSEICDRTKMGIPSYYRYFPKDDGKESIMQIDTFLRLCNVFKVWPGSFLTGRGEEIPVLQDYTEALVVKNSGDIRLMTPEEKELVDMRRKIALATKSSEPIAALQKQYDLALEAKMKAEREKHARSRERFNKRIELLQRQVDEQTAVIADLRQQLKEARFYASSHDGGYTARIAAEDPKD